VGEEDEGLYLVPDSVTSWTRLCVGRVKRRRRFAAGTGGFEGGFSGNIVCNCAFIEESSQASGK